MARQVLTLAKIIPGVDTNLDDIVMSAQSGEDLDSLAFSSMSGRGLLYWARWYDPWLVGADLEPGHWPLPLRGKETSDQGLFLLSLDHG